MFYSPDVSFNNRIFLHLSSGVLTENMNMKIGALNDGSFLPVTVNVSISFEDFLSISQIHEPISISFSIVNPSQQGAMPSRSCRSKCLAGLCAQSESIDATFGIDTFV